MHEYSDFKYKNDTNKIIYLFHRHLFRHWKHITSDENWLIYLVECCNEIFSLKQRHHEEGDNTNTLCVVSKLVWPASGVLSCIYFFSRIRVLCNLWQSKSIRHCYNLSVYDKYSLCPFVQRIHGECCGGK